MLNKINFSIDTLVKLDCFGGNNQTEYRYKKISGEVYTKGGHRLKHNSLALSNDYITGFLDESDLRSGDFGKYGVRQKWNLDGFSIDGDEKKQLEIYIWTNDRVEDNV